MYKLAEEKLAKLEKATAKANAMGGDIKAAEDYRDDVIPAMNELRKVADELELKTAKKYWPFPTYGDILFGID